MPSDEQIVSNLSKQIEENRRRDSLVYCTVAVRRLVGEVEAFGSLEIATDLTAALQKLEKLRHHREPDVELALIEQRQGGRA